MNSQNTEIPPEVRGFLENLLAEANMTFVDDEMKEEMVQELYKRLDSFLTSTIVNKLPSEYYDEFIKLNEEGKPKEEVEQFLKGHIPNAEGVFADAFVEFRNLYLGNASVGTQPGSPQKDTNQAN